MGRRPGGQGALAGIDPLLPISGSEIGQRAQQHRNVIEAVRRARA